MRWAAPLILLIGLSCVGCSRSGGSNSLWNANWDDPGPVPGIHQGSVITVSGAVASAPKVLIWTDLPECNALITTSAFGATMKADLKSLDGSKTLAITSDVGAIKDAQSGTVSVNGRNVELKDGHVILISTKSSPPEILQLEVPAGDELWKIVDSGPEVEDAATELQIYAKSHASVGDFFRKQVPTETPAASAAPTN